MLPFLAAFKQIAQADVTLGGVMEVIEKAASGVDQRQVFPVGEQGRVGAEIRGDLLRLTLLHRGASGQQTVVVLQRRLDGLIERDGDRPRRRLPARKLQEQRTGERGVQNGTVSFQGTPPERGAYPPPLPSTHTKWEAGDRKSTRLNSSHLVVSYAVFCLKKKRT